MKGAPLAWFFFCSGAASMMFLCSSLICVYQIIAVNEMSDETEQLIFFDNLGHETLSGQLMALGLYLMFAASFNYMWNTQKLGILNEDAGFSAYLLITLTVLVIGYSILYATSSLIRTVYATKIDAAHKELKANEIR